MTSSKVRCKKTEGQHFEEVVPSFKEVVKQDRDLKLQGNKQTLLKDAPIHDINGNFHYFYMALVYYIILRINNVAMW